MDSDKNKRKLSKLKTNTLSRGISLLNLTVSSGARFAGLKLGDMFVEKKDRKQRFENFLSEQAGILVEELGRLKGSIMKAGQMLSVYGEHFLPPEVNRVLKALQSESRPVAWEEMEKVLLRQLGPETLQKLDIDPEPFAAASMGQVYRATVKSSGQILALKVQYPGVDQAIDSDLKALYTILSLSHIVPKGPSFDEIYKEIRMMLHHEADYQRELTMAEQYREWLKDDPRFVVPQVFPEFSGKRVLAMSFEEGVAVDGDEVKALSQERRNHIAAACLELLFREIFEWRTVQTDPHFGNFRVKLDPEQGDRLVLLDFGAVRKFPQRYIENFAALVRSAVEQDPEGVCLAGLKLGFLRDDDAEEVFELFAEICATAVEPYAEECASPAIDGSEPGPHPYDWAKTTLVKQMTALAKDAVFTFRFRSPPREAVFLDRKMVGVFFFISALGLQMGPRKLILKYLDLWKSP